MRTIHLIVVVNKDGREIVTGAFENSEKAKDTAAGMLNQKDELMTHSLRDAIDTDDGEEFDAQYEDFLFNRHLAEQVLTIKVQPVILQ